ncbi:trehalose-phosphatase [Microbacterium esteraromaticum]|uniref:Trehalose 6-phosphate phosphatase n=1 Tax=Microbacterium esteraromaticum TaxID=57043 RepID=A0A7D8AAD3_9MICO|nr:trehalose-phosphatase [Microbacterium esteraromaticum]QMU98000.1 trehalose-phosphatase [Microbacterium esteraromaticum]
MTRDWRPGAPDEAVTAIAHTERLLVALDFDGTASELVADPMTARAIPEMKRAVADLSVLPGTTVAFVSGRSLVHLREIAEHADDSPVVLAGSHGAQYWYPGEGEADAVSDDPDRMLRDTLLEELTPLLSDYPGVELESKTFGIGIHGRPARPDVEQAAFAAVDEVFARRAKHWRRRTGDRILEYSSRLEGKDTAIAVLRERIGATGILFAGDDVTDEDALRVLAADDLGVRVGPGETAATLRVESPQQMAGLLEVIASERAARRQ